MFRRERHGCRDGRLAFRRTLLVTRRHATVHRNSLRRAATLTAVGAVVVAMTSTGTAFGQPANPGTPGTSGPGFQSENTGHHDLDNRTGVLTPTARQRSLAAAAVSVRWNRYGTPATVVPRVATAPAGAQAAASVDPLV